MNLRKGSFSGVNSYMQLDNDLMCFNYLCVNLEASHNLLKNLEQETKIGYWSVIFHIIFSRDGFLSRREMRADLKCEGKKPSESE